MLKYFAQIFLGLLPLVPSISHAVEMQMTEPDVRPPVFRVVHSQSPNEVLYQIRQNNKGGIDKENPLQVHWLMRTKSDSIEKLTYLERKLAFGYEVEEIRESECVIRLNAIKDKTIHFKDNGCGEFVGIIEINQEQSFIKEVFIDFKHTLFGPHVNFIDFSGISIDSGLPVAERLLNK